jgi:hypothetical protein
MVSVATTALEEIARVHEAASEKRRKDEEPGLPATHTRGEFCR